MKILHEVLSLFKLDNRLCLLETPTYHQDTQKQSEAYLSPEFKRKLETWNDKMKETKGKLLSVV